MDVVGKKLVTPVGLRTLSPDDPEYKPIYGGDLRSRDGAYHQGTVWAWLIGAFVDAWLKVHPHDRAAARKFLETFPLHLSDNGIGTISEVFDAREPHTPGVASPKPGAWQKFCAPGQRPRSKLPVAGGVSPAIPTVCLYRNCRIGN